MSYLIVARYAEHSRLNTTICSPLVFGVLLLLLLLCQFCPHKTINLLFLPRIKS